MNREVFSMKKISVFLLILAFVFSLIIGPCGAVEQAKGQTAADKTKAKAGKKPELTGKTEKTDKTGKKEKNEKPSMKLRKLTFTGHILSGEVYNNTVKIANEVVIRVEFKTEAGKTILSREITVVPGGSGATLNPHYSRQFKYLISIKGIPVGCITSGKVLSVKWNEQSDDVSIQSLKLNKGILEGKIINPTGKVVEQIQIEVEFFDSQDRPLITQDYQIVPGADGHPLPPNSAKTFSYRIDLDPPLPDGSRAEGKIKRIKWAESDL
jgi:hypothetical protein